MSGEKNFAPTAKRKQDAAKRGDVLRSKDLGTAVGTVAGFAALAAFGPWIGQGLALLVTDAFTFNHLDFEGPPQVATSFASIAQVIVPVALLTLALGLLTFSSQLIFGNGRWLPGNAAPKFDRINPLKGLQRSFGITGAIEMGKGLLKVSLLGAIVFAWGKSWIGELDDLARATLGAQIALAWKAILSLGFALGFGLTLIVFVDLPIEIIRRNNRLKMTLEEVREEHKESEGSPEAKSHRRQRQREIAAGALAPAMREAQFVITNPTHFSVALSYDPEKAPAPVVVAKGRGEKALAIRELATERALPILESPALARSIYYTARERQMIRTELYSAVASIVAFVLALGRGEAPPFPTLEVPIDLRFDANGKREG